MALDVLLIKQPYEIAWSGNDMLFTFCLSPYGNPEVARNLQLRLQVQVEAVFNSGQFSDVYNTLSAPNRQGLIHINVNGTIDAYLKYFIPPVVNTEMIECPEQTKRYRIIYTLVDDVSVVVAAQTSPALYAIKGGMAKEFSNFVEYFSAYNYFLTPLYLGSGQGGYIGSAVSDLYQKGETRFLYFLSRQDITVSGTPARVKAFDKSGVVALTHTFSISSVIKYRVYCIPVSPWQLFPAVNEDAFGYIQADVSPFGGGSVTLRVDHRKWYQTHQLVYRNSTGGLDTITMRGQVDYEADYNRQAATQTPFPERFLDGILVAEQVTAFVSEQYKLKGDTGFITKERLEALRDLFLSLECYEVISGKLIPIFINVKNAKLYTNDTRLYAAQVEWQPAFENEYYTPANLAVATASCPAVEKLVVRQISSRRIEIMWSLRSPYHQLQVEVNVQGNIQLLTLSGNVGKVEQAITLTGTVPVDIFIRARTICNAYTTPMDMGPWMAIVYTALPDRPPVATWDTFNVPQGLSVAYTIPTSVLANDYDPDGDPIEVVPNSGITPFAGGAFAINNAGIVTYLPPYPAFTGIDLFDYVVLEPVSGLTANARVILNIGGYGAGGGANIFVKLVERNVISTVTGSSSRTVGERWLDFFSDPAGTVPMDITGRNIILNYREVRQTLPLVQTPVYTPSPNYTHNLTIAGIGNRVKIYSGDLLTKRDIVVSTPPTYVTYHVTTTITHSQLTGSGYTPI